MKRPVVVHMEPQDALEEFLDWATTAPSSRGQLRKDRTLIYYRSSLNQLVKWLARNSVALADINARHMRRYFYDREKTDGASRTTIYHDYTTARKFLDWCRRERLVSGVPLEDIVYRKPRPKPVECPSAQDVEKLLVALRDRWNRDKNPDAKYAPDRWRERVERRDWCMVFAIYLTGARPGEIVKLREEDVLNPKTPRPSIRFVDTKTGVDRIVPVTKEWITALESYKRVRPVDWDSPLLFHGEYLEPLSSAWLSRKWKKYAEFAGLPHITLKWFRRYRSKYIVQSGDLSTAADLMGNSPKVLRENYLAKDLDHQRLQWEKSLAADPVFNRESLKRMARRERAR